MRRSSFSGQGSLEYLLLIGAGALVALLAFLLLLFLGPYGGLLFEQNVDEYKKIDLCTASDNAACSLNLNWNQGLIVPPNGFFLEKKNWRTLQLDGISFKVFCTDGICDGDGFLVGQGPTINLEFPVDSLGNYCDPGPETSTCLELTLYLCELEGTAFTGTCSTSFDFTDWHDQFPSQPDVTFRLTDDFPSKEVVIKSVGNINNKDLVSVQIAMKVSEVDSDGITTLNEGWDDKAEKLSWYSTAPFLFGSSFQCNNLATDSSDNVDFGCIFPPNCSPVACPAATDTSPLGTACADFGVEEGDFVCSIGSGYAPATCFGEAVPFFTHKNGIGAAAPFVSMDISSLKGAIFLKDFSPALAVSVDNFNEDFKSICDADMADCSAVCSNFAGPFSNLHFYVLNNPPGPVDSENLCSQLSDPSFSSLLDLDVSLLKGEGPIASYVDLDPTDEGENIFYSCTQRYDLSGTFVSSVLNAPGSPDIVYIGARFPLSYLPDAFRTESPFTSTSSFSMGAFYYAG